MALSLINSNVFEHCRITLKLDNANFFPQLGLFTRCSAIADFFYCIFDCNTLFIFFVFNIWSDTFGDMFLYSSCEVSRSLTNVAAVTAEFKLTTRLFSWGVIRSFLERWSIGFDMNRTLGFTAWYVLLVISIIFFSISFDSTPIYGSFNKIGHLSGPWGLIIFELVDCDFFCSHFVVNAEKSVWSRLYTVEHKKSAHQNTYPMKLTI